MTIPDAIKINFTGTPEKFQSTLEGVFLTLMELLTELCRLEDQYFVQDKRLDKKGRVITFKDGVREEITQYDALKAKFGNLYHQLLDPCCTPNMLAQRRDCIHGTHYPSDFNCLRTGCSVILIMKSANKAVIDLLPNDGDIPYDMTDPDVRYMAEDFTVNPPYNYIYLTKYRFTMKAAENGWKIDTVHSAGLDDTRWRRDYYF